MDYSLLGELALYGTASYGLLKLAIAGYEDHKLGLLLRELADVKMLKNGNGVSK